MKRPKKLSPTNTLRYIAALANKEKVSVAELLARAKVDRSTPNRWKNGKRKPNERTIIVIESVCKN